MLLGSAKEERARATRQVELRETEAGPLCRSLMKSRAKELLDRSIAAMAGAVEIYNKPGFAYRNESFAILAINAWELLLKAKWLALHNNQLRCLYVYEHRINKAGARSKKEYVKRTRSNTPFTHDIAYLSNRLRGLKILDPSAHDNLEAMLEFRDCAVHFYNDSPAFNERLYEIGAACVRNFAYSARDWFSREVGEFDIQLMPITFLNLPKDVTAFLLNVEEQQFLAFLDSIYDTNYEPESAYAVALNVEFRFVKSKGANVLHSRTTNDPSAFALRVSEEDIREKYPWDYFALNERCRARYKDFKINGEYHRVRKPLQEDERYAKVRFLDPTNPNSSKKVFFNSNILQELDKHYQRN